MVTIQPPERIGNKTVLFRYSSDLGGTPTFYIYLDGIRIAETKLTQYEIAIGINENSIVEILDDSDTQPQPVYPGRVRLGWFFVEDAQYYLIEEYVGAAWVPRRKVPDAGGYHAWMSRFLEDCQTHQFRITPVGIDGNEGTAKTFTILMVRHPDVPDVAYSYSNSTNKVTVAAG